MARRYRRLARAGTRRTSPSTPRHARSRCESPRRPCRRGMRSLDREGLARVPPSAAAPIAAAIPWLLRKARLVLRQFKVALGELLDVDVLERDYPHVLDETRRPIHVPYPGVLHDDLEEHFPVVCRLDVHLDVVRQVEPALGLDNVGEQADYIAVLAVELKLHLGFILLQVFRA